MVFAEAPLPVPCLPHSFFVLCHVRTASALHCRPFLSVWSSRMTFLVQQHCANMTGITAGNAPRLLPMRRGSGAPNGDPPRTAVAVLIAFCDAALHCQPQNRPLFVSRPLPSLFLGRAQLYDDCFTLSSAMFLCLLFPNSLSSPPPHSQPLTSTLHLLYCPF